MAFGSADRSAHVGRQVGDDPDAAVPPAALAQALGQLWTAVHHLSDEKRAALDTAPPRRAIDEWCLCMSAFDALAYVANYLDIRVQILEDLYRNAPNTARSRLSDDA